MRLVSNKESVARGEVSILAIVETLLAIALVFYLSAHFNTLRWLAVAMCVSPLLLLRTEESTRLAIEWYEAMTDWYGERVGFDHCGWRAFLFGLVELGFNFFVAPSFARIVATFVTVVHQPAAVFQSIPSNWARATLAVDTFLGLESLPEYPRGTFRELWDGVSALNKEKPLAIRMPKMTVLPFVLVFFFLPALLYRWSMKATSIIYAPLVFVAHSTFSEGADLRTKLELIKRGDLSRIRVWYGVIAIAAFLVKLVLMMNLPGFADWWNGHPVSQFLALYIAPAEIPKWQLAELANSALAIGAMLFARHALLRDELKHPLPEAPVKRLLGFVSGLRWVLALYAILCTGYITMRAAQHWHWPALGEKWLPW